MAGDLEGHASPRRGPDHYLDPRNTSSGLPEPLPEPTEEDREDEERVPYYRVQGGSDENKKGKRRVSVVPPEYIRINRRGKMLYLSAEDPTHARYYLTTQREGGDVVEWTEPDYLHKLVRELAEGQNEPKKEDGIRRNNRLANEMADKTTPGFSLGLAPGWFPWFEEYGRDAEKLSEDEFYRRYGRPSD